MAVRLLVGRAGSGKTSRALTIFKQFAPAEHQPSVRFIVPTFPQVLHLRRLLLADSDFPGLLGDPICTFYELSRDVLLRARLGRHRRISDMQKLLMLREIIRESPAGYFDAIRDCPNFPEALGGAIGSLKVAVIGPDDLRAAVAQAGDRLPESSRRKLLDLAALYQYYQKDVLEAKGIHDPEGVIWRALALVQDNPEFLGAFQCVILDGFPTLTPVQREFIRLMAQHSGEVVVTMDYDELRPEVFSYIEQAVRFLTELPGTKVEHLSRVDAQVDTPLNHLQQHLFGREPPKRKPDDSITIMVGATPAMEIELAAGEIKKLVRERGYGFTDIGIVARHIGPYRQRIASTFRDYGIPSTLGGSYPLSESGFARAILLCLRVVLGGWRREHVLGVLKSTYIRCDADECSRIENLAKALGIQVGRATWFEPWLPGDETLDPRTRILEPIGSFADSFRGTASDLRAAVESLVANFRWHESDELLQEDYAAWKSIRGIMREIEDSEKILERHFAPQEFADLLELGIRTGTYRMFGRAAEGVSLVNANALGGEKFKVVFVIGLLEKMFPRQEREDPFIRDAEREILNPYLAHPLDPHLEGQSYERYLFYMTASSAQERLYLTYPSADASAKDSLPSFYLDEVDALFSPRVRRIARDLSRVVPPIDQAETGRALAAGTVLDCCTAREEDAQVTAMTAFNLLIEGGALSADAFDWAREREACLTDERILEYFREHAPVYHITELETYGACPFRHFCEHELKLSQVEEEPGALQRGAILHRVLYRLYTALFEGGQKPDLREDEVVRLALALLDACIQEERQVANMPVHLLHIERSVMADMLRRFLRTEIADLNETQFLPTHFELEFGRREDGKRERDRASTTARFKLPAGDGVQVELVGKIDRVDVAPDGRAIVVDYKSGMCPGLNNVEKGTVLQAPLYSLALREMFSLEPVAAEYRSLKKPERSGMYADTEAHPSGERARSVSPDLFEERIKTALAHLARHVERMRRADIQVRPVDCVSYCGFRPVCRIDRWRLLLLKDIMAASEVSSGEETSPP